MRIKHGDEAMMKRRDLLAQTPAVIALFTAAHALAESKPAEPPKKGIMQYRKLGPSDLRVSVVGLGCNAFGAGPDGGGPRRLLDLEKTRAVVNAAYESGVTFFDTADMYGIDGGSETFLGEILKDRRKEVVIATKWGGGAKRRGEVSGTRDYIRTSVEASLKRLQTDYIDLYFYHFPDEQTPILETLKALDEIKKEGKVREIACSNFSLAQLEEADKVAKANKLARFICVENQYSLLETDAEKDVLPACARLNIGFIPYFPLASGLLTGKYRRDKPAPADAKLANRPIDDSTYDRIEALEKFATQRGHTLLELAIAGLTARPEIASVIAGATKPEQIRENAASVGWQLSAADIAELRKLTTKT